jgi:hypothetical protein
MDNKIACYAIYTQEEEATAEQLEEEEKEEEQDDRERRRRKRRRRKLEKDGRGMTKSPYSMPSSDLYQCLLATKTPFMARLECILNTSSVQIAVVTRNISIAMFMSTVLPDVRLWTTGSHPSGNVLITVDELLQYDIDMSVYGKIILLREQQELDKHEATMAKISQCAMTPSSTRVVITILNQL